MMTENRAVILRLMDVDVWIKRSDLEEKYYQKFGKWEFNLAFRWLYKNGHIEIKENTWPQEIRKRPTQELYEYIINNQIKI